MNLVIWVVPVVLAIMVAGAGLGKVTQTREKLRQNANLRWVEDCSQTEVRGIGILGILAAVALILPSALKIAPVLTPVAALGVIGLMIGAAVTHLRRQELRVLPITIILRILAAVVVLERFALSPVA